MKRRNLIVFTHGAPFANGENAFLLPELPILAETFERVILVPDAICHSFPRCETHLPTNVEVYSEKLIKKHNSNLSLARAFLTLKWIRDIRRIKRPSDFKTCLSDIAAVNAFKSVFPSLILDLDLDLNDTLFYTFWMTHEASGLAELSLKYKALRFISRAHGYDLYDYRTNFRSKYYRELTIRQSQGVYSCSKDGASHLENRYSCPDGKIKIGYLGVECAGVLPAPVNADEDVLRLVTVASLVPVKQHVRFVNALSEYAKTHTKLQIIYDIIGDGYYRQKVEEACIGLPKNLCVKLYGVFSNTRVLEHYSTTPYDLFVLPSKSEGLSVAVMEAMAREVPALVTNVGGMGELVRDKQTGFLIPGEFTEGDVAAALDEYLMADSGMLRKAARKLIETHFDRKKCREEFVQCIADKRANMV